MLGLKLSTDPRWVKLAESNLAELLTDHAFCEQKAASNAISLIVNYPEYTEMVRSLLVIAQEELAHFKMVHDKIVERGWVLGPERKDDYVNDLMKFMRKGQGRHIALIDRLLFAAMIEARSCERFKMLSEKVEDKELAEFYRDLMASEANHYTVFLNFARQYAQGEDVERRWLEFLDYEAEVIAGYGKKETMHG